MSPNPFRSRRARSAGAAFLPVALAAVVAAAILAACSGAASPAASAGASRPSAAASAGSSGGSGAERLAATMPTQVGDVAMTVDSGTLPDLKDEIPSYDTLVQRLSSAGIQPGDVLGAVSRPTDGSADPKVSGLTVVQAPPGGLGMYALMAAWTSGIEGATSSNTNVGGKPVVKVTFADGSAPLYYYLITLSPGAQEADTTYFVRTADETLAADALSQLP